MAEERIAVGDFVRISPDSGLHPRATDADIGPHTAAFSVSAYDKETKIATLTRQGQTFGEYPESALIKVDPPIDNTVPKPPPPDTQVGGLGAGATRRPPGPVNPFPPKGR